MASVQAPVQAGPASGDKIEGMMRRVLGHLLWVVPALAAVALYYVRNYAGLYYNDAMDLAQLGRHISQGQGYVTSFIRPLAWAVKPTLFGQPELYQAPLFPLVLGSLFLALGASDLVAALGSVVFHIGTLTMVYLLGRRLFGHTAAALAAVLVAVNLQLVAYAISGLAVPLATFLVTLAVYLLYTNQGSVRRSALCGAIMGLACLAEYACVGYLVAAAVLAVVLAPGRRAKHLAGFLLGAVVVLAPWAYRNAVVAGNPFFTLKLYWLAMFSTAHPGSSLLRTTDLAAAGPLAFVTGSPGALARKWVVDSKALLEMTPALTGLYLVPFLVVGLLRRLGDKRATVLRNWVVAAVVGQAVLIAFFNPSPELLTPLVPVAAVLATGYFVLFAGELGRRRFRWAAALLIAVTAYPLASNLALAQPARNVSLRNLQYLQRTLQPDEAVVTDAPWAVAWYTGLTAVWLPGSLEDFNRLDGGGKIRAIYLSAMLPSYPAAEGVAFWQQLYYSRVGLTGFDLQATLPPGELIFGRSIPVEGSEGGKR